MYVLSLNCKWGFLIFYCIGTPKPFGKTHKSINNFAASKIKLVVLPVIWEFETEFSHGIILFRKWYYDLR